jgi:hypothetical protein
MWYAKMYFSGDREIFEYDAAGIQGAPMTRKELPFLESLLSFQELDCGEFVPALERISGSWERLLTANNRQAGTDAMVELRQLAARHIYFHLLYVRAYDRFSRIGAYGDLGSAEDYQILEELKQTAAQLSHYQRQVQRFLELVLDVDHAGRDPQKQAADNYIFDVPKDESLFVFRPIPLGFERVEEGKCSPVLYSSAIRDMIDYSLRSCVEREITVRRCKNCGRWFPQMVRISAEYCERPVKKGEQTCRETGAFRKWSKKETEDPIFKAYRKEYKRRFAWIKAGRITDEEFYAWSEKAREEKKKCDSGTVTLEEFQQWLKLL